MPVESPTQLMMRLTPTVAVRTHVRCVAVAARIVTRER